MDERKACCRSPDNLEHRSERPTVVRGQLLGDLAPRRLAGDLAMSVCKVCGCRHFELMVDPGEIGLRGSAL